MSDGSRRTPAGSNLVEYGLAAAIIAIGSLTALFALGGNVNDLLQAVKEDFGGNITAAETSVPGTPQPPPVDLAPGTTRVTITLGNGETITLDSYPSDMSATIQTAGGSGTTELLADALRQMIRQLLEAGEIDQVQAGSLMALADAGHHMAEAHAFLEAAATSCDNLYCFDAYIGESGSGWNIDTVTVAEGLRMGGEYQSRLENAYTQAINEGALDHPRVQQIVSILKTQIDMMGDARASQVDMVQAGLIQDQNTAMYDLNRLMAAEFGSQTHRNAADICRLGGDADSGISCSSH